MHCICQNSIIHVERYIAACILTLTFTADLYSNLVTIDSDYICEENLMLHIIMHQHDKF